MKKTKRIAFGVSGIFLSVLILVFILRKVDIHQVGHIIAGINKSFLLFLPVIYLATFLLRGFRWKMMLMNSTQLPIRDFIGSVVVGYAGNNLLPVRGGEILRMEYFSRKSKVNRITTLSSILTERVLDGLVLVFILVSVLVISSELTQFNWVKRIALFTSSIFVLAVIFLVLIKYFGIKLGDGLPDNGRIWIWIRHGIHKISKALYFIQFDRTSLYVLGLSMGIWLLEGTVFVIGLLAFDLSVNPLIVGYFCLTMVNFGILIPSSPGYIGVYQAVTILALSLFSINKEIALSYGILVHLIQFLPVTLWGLIILSRNSLKLMNTGKIAVNYD